MAAADEQEELNDPVPMVLGSASKEGDSESRAAREEIECARFIAQMDLAGPEVLRVMPAVTLLLLGIVRYFSYNITPGD